MIAGRVVVEVFGSARGFGGERDVDGDRGGQIQCGEPTPHGRGEIRGVVGVLAAFLIREGVPEVCDGFVGLVVRDFSRGGRSAGPGLRVECGEQCDVGRSSPQPALPSTTR